MQNIYNAPDKEKLLPQNLTIKKKKWEEEVSLCYTFLEKQLG